LQVALWLKDYKATKEDLEKLHYGRQNEILDADR